MMPDLELIREDYRAGDDGGLDIVIVHEMGRYKPQSWSKDAEEDDKGWMWLSDIFPDVTEGIRCMMFKYDDAAGDGIDMLAPHGLTRLANCLLQHILKEGSERTLAFVAHGFGGLIVKEALVMAEQNAEFLSISRRVVQLVFFGVPHRPSCFSTWEDMLLGILFASRLPLPGGGNMATKLQQLSRHLAKSASDFLALPARQCVINVYQKGDDAGLVGPIIDRYSATLGLVYETNLAAISSHDEIFKSSQDGAVFTVIASSLRAETIPDYHLCLSRFFELSPPFKIPDDQIDLYIREPETQVLAAFDEWITGPQPPIMVTTGDKGIGKSLVARAVFRRAKNSKMPLLVTYFSFAENDVFRASTVSFLASISFQILKQDPERFHRIKGLLTAIEDSGAWTEAGLYSLLQSLLDIKTRSGPLVLVIDGIHRCDSSFGMLIQMLLRIADTKDPLTTMKVAMFYQQRQDIRELLFSEYEQHLVLSGPTITPDTPVPMADALAATSIRDRPYLVEIKEELEASLLACRYTTEMLLVIRRIDLAHAAGSFSTKKLLHSILGMEPPTIVDTVSSVFNELSEWGRVAVGWIAHSKRPLRLNEIATAVAITNNAAHFRASFSLDELPLDTAAAVNSCFGPLVRVGDGILMFCNDDVRHEFHKQIKQDAPQRKIESARANGEQVSDLASIPTEENITSVLIQYLSWPDFSDPINTELRKDTRFIPPSGRLFDLMEYAVQFLPHHYRASRSAENQKLLGQSRRLAVTWSRLNSMLNPTASPSDLCVSDPLFLAAQLGLTDIVAALGNNMDVPCREVVLRLASWSGNLDTVKVVLEGAANENSLDCSAALECASARGYDLTVVHYLLQYVKSKTTEDRRVTILSGLLCRAAELGFETQAELFIANGAQPNAAADDITPLQHAARNGHAGLVNKLLTAHSADVESSQGNGEDKAILLAAGRGYRQVIQHLVDAGAELSCLTRDDSKQTPLHLAAAHGHTEVARLLLDAEKQRPERQPALNLQCSQGRSPLITACAAGHAQVAMLLLAANADVAMADSQEHTALYYAMRTDDKNLPLEILKHVTSLESFRDAGGVFLLAAKVGHYEILSRYATARDPEDKMPLVEYRSSENGNTALHEACSNGHAKVVDLLLQSGAAVQAVNDEDHTPLVLAAEAGKPEIVATLLAHGGTPGALGGGETTVITLASSYSEDTVPRAEVATMLLRAGVDVNAAMGGQTALILAVSRGKLEMTRAILRDPNVDANVTASFRWNALHYAAQYRHKNVRRIAELLMKAGTDPMALDTDDWLPLHLAAQNGNIVLMELLLEHNPESLEAKADDGRTALHFSIDHDKAEATKWLLDHGADVNATDNEGKTAVTMIATGRGNSEHLTTLLNWKDCNVCLAQDNGWTPLHHAALSGSARMGRRLLEANAEILSRRDENNLSALHLAINSSKTEFAKMLLDEFYVPSSGELGNVEEFSATAMATTTPSSTSIDDLSAVETQRSHTPLISAVQSCQWEVMRKLLKLGAAWDHRDKRGRTALLHAIQNFEDDQNLKVIQDLLNTDIPNPISVNEGGGIYPSALHEAACITCTGQMSLIEELVERQGAQVNKQGGQYGTALGAAAATSHLEVAQYLLKSGEQVAGTSSWSPADPHLPAGKYANALNAALYSWTFQLVKPLLDAGHREVQVSATDLEGRSALHLAARRGNWELIQELRPKNAGPEAFLADKHGRTLLHFAAMSGNYRTFLLLLADEEMNWESLDVKDADGWTPLHWACRQDANSKIVESLIQYGADVILPAGNDGWTAENIANSHGASAAAALIQEALAHISMPRRQQSEPPGSDETTKEERPARRHWKTGQLHRGICCDSCLLLPIAGIRWICNDCADFDLCFKCYRHVKVTHDPAHKFTRVPSGESSYWKPELESETTDDSSSSE